MKIYRRAQFLNLPAGTIYAKGEQWCFDGFSVKADTISNDWVCLSPMWIEANGEDEQWERLNAMLEDGAAFPMDTIYGRDGTFNDEQIFLVPDRADLEKLRAIIDAAIDVAPSSDERTTPGDTQVKA